MSRYLLLAALALFAFATPAAAVTDNPGLPKPYCLYTATPPTLTDKEVHPLRCDANGQLIDTGASGSATAANQTATQANPGSDASKATAVQGVTGGKAVTTTTPNAGSPTYTYAASYPAYSTPQDMVGICGSGTKTVRVVNMGIGINSTAAAAQTFHFVKRSTADTGGTDGAPTGIAVDSANAAPTATLHAYTALPTLGTSVGDFRLQSPASTVLTATPGSANFFAPSNIDPSNLSGTDVEQHGVTLRGTNECLYINYAGAALPSGFVFPAWYVMWAEF